MPQCRDVGGHEPHAHEAIARGRRLRGGASPGKGRAELRERLALVGTRQGPTRVDGPEPVDVGVLDDLDRHRQPGGIEQVDPVGGRDALEPEHPLDDLGAVARQRVDHAEDHLVARAVRRRRRHQRPERLPRQLFGRIDHALEADLHCPVHLVGGTPADGVVGMILQQQAPRLAEEARRIGTVVLKVEVRREGLGARHERGLGGVVLLLEIRTTGAHPRQDVVQPAAEELAAIDPARYRGGLQRRQVVGEASRSDLGCRERGPQRREHLRQLRLEREVIAPVVEQGNPRRTPLAHLREQPRHALHRQSGLHAARGADVLVPLESQRPGVAVAAPLMHGEHPAAVGGLPDELETHLLDLVAVAPGVDERVDPDAAEELRELRGMSERVGHVAHLLHATQALGHLVTPEEIPHQRLTADQEAVGEHVPGSDGQRPAPHLAADAIPVLRTHPQVVLGQDRLPVEHEVPKRSVLQRVQDPLHDPHQLDAERVDAPIPLAVEVRVRHQIGHAGRASRRG